jgi:hypothetical protein
MAIGGNREPLPLHDVNLGKTHCTYIVVVMRTNLRLIFAGWESVGGESPANPLAGFEDLILYLHTIFILQIIEDHCSEESSNSCTNNPDTECSTIAITSEL